MKSTEEQSLKLFSHERLLLAILADSVKGEAGISVSLMTEWKDAWEKLADMAERHGVSSVVADFMEIVPKEVLPPKLILLTLIGQKMEQESVYQRQWDIASQFADELNKKGVKVFVLKGIAFSTYYRNPAMRECGDCDCYLLRNNGEKAYALGNETAQEMGWEAAFGTYKHSHIHADGLMIENHRYLTDFNNTAQGKRIERLLEDVIKNEDGTRIGDSQLVRPCAHFNALFLIKHALQDFIEGGLSLRMVYDWLAFLHAEQNNLDWNRLYGDMEQCRLRRFADIMTVVCRDYLGLQFTTDDINPRCDKEMVEAVLKDTLRGGSHLIPNESFAHKTVRILKRFMRMWKYRTLATESVPVMIWNSFAFSSYLKRDIDME